MLYNDFSNFAKGALCYVWIDPAGLKYGFDPALLGKQAEIINKVRLVARLVCPIPILVIRFYYWK